MAEKLMLQLEVTGVSARLGVHDRWEYCATVRGAMGDLGEMRINGDTFVDINRRLFGLVPTPECARAEGRESMLQDLMSPSDPNPHRADIDERNGPANSGRDDIDERNPNPPDDDYGLTPLGQGE